MPPETDAEKIARLEKLVEELRGTVEQLRRELEEWKRGHRVRDRKRRGRKAKAAAAPPEGAAVGEGAPNRTPGRASGHVGVGRPGPDHVDNVVPCRAEGPCTCGGVLGDVGIGRRHRVEELVISIEVTEYQCMRQECDRCGAVTEAPLPAELGGAPKVGPHAQAVAMALRFDTGLPISAISRVFDEIFHLPFSPGGLSQMFGRNLAKCAAAVDEIWTQLNTMPLAYSDETGWWENGSRAWLWAATNEDLSAFMISPWRDRASFEAMVSCDYDGIVATDAYSAYDHLPEHRHPQCWGHVLRTARDIAEIHDHPDDAAMHAGIKAFIAVAKIHRVAAWPSPQTLVDAEAAFEVAVASGATAAHPKLVTLGARLARQRVRYQLCLHDKLVPLTTNQVERDLRGHIPVRKLSFGTRNGTGSWHWGQGASLCQTLKKQHGHLVDYIPDALAEVARGRPPPSIFKKPD